MSIPFIDAISNLLDKYAASQVENERLRESLKRLLLEFDFLIEDGYLADIRNDVIFDEARAALATDPMEK